MIVTIPGFHSRFAQSFSSAVEILSQMTGMFDEGNQGRQTNGRRRGTTLHKVTRSERPSAKLSPGGMQNLIAPDTQIK